MFADDLCLAYQCTDFDDGERVVTDDLQTVGNYFNNWRLVANPDKSEVSSFHLNNKEASRELNVEFQGVRLKHNFAPKYLGVNLDRSLTYNDFLTKRAAKIKTRNNMIHSLAGTTWGANANCLRQSAMSLVIPVAEYCAPTWLNSVHRSKIDVQLNNTMRIITGTVKSTPLSWLPVLSNITPPGIRRKTSYINTVRRSKAHGNSMLNDMLNSLPDIRLTSRKVPWELIEQQHNEKAVWRNEWSQTTLNNKDLIQDPTAKQPGFALNRKEWVALNRFRTGHGRCKFFLNKWGIEDDSFCECGEEQTMNHIVNDCTIHKYNRGIKGLHNLRRGSVEWLQSLQVHV